MMQTITHITPLAHFVLFMIVLAIGGAALAGAHYVAIDIPRQQELEDYARCTGGCVSTNVMISTPYGPRNPGDESCRKDCYERFLRR